MRCCGGFVLLVSLALASAKVQDVLMRKSAPVRTDDVLMRKNAPVRTDDVLMRKSAPVRTDDVLMRKSAPVRTDDVLMRKSAPVRTHDVLMRKSAPVRTDDVLMRKSAPVRTDDVLMRKSAPVRTDDVLMRKNAPVRTDDVLMRKSAPVRTDDVLMRKSAPVRTHDVLMRKSAPVRTDDVLMRKSAPVRTVSLLNPELEGRVPESSLSPFLPSALTPPSLDQDQNPALPGDFLFGDNVNLEWKEFDGSIPNGAVSIYNGYTERSDYVCKYQCEAGFYQPTLGPYCRYPYGDREYYAPEFQLLTNRDNFEFLEWKEDSYGSVPKHSVRTCANVGIYVGKNKYGLGKVVPQFEAFFLPWEGDEYWYKKYQVMTINRDMYTQHVSDVKYAIDEAAIFQYPPETMQLSGVTNNECQSVSKMVTLSKTTELETTWSIGRGTMIGVTGSITAKIPFIGEGGIELGGEKTLQFDRGTTHVEAISHSVSVELTVPPNHSCRVRMEGRRFKADVPYSARLSRTYRNGETQWTSIAGTYDGVQIGEVRAVVERCEPVSDALPCP